jgi:uncharacterized protein (DUF983 family)
MGPPFLFVRRVSLAKKQPHYEDQAHYPVQSAISTGLAGRCPRCGEGKLFKSLLKPVDRCAICGLDMSFAEEGDGPAVLVILLLGFVVAGLALSVEYLLRPPVWVHIILWVPVITALALISLRWMKGVMIAAQYMTKAAEGRLENADQE